MLTYPAGTQWRYSSRRSGHELTAELMLLWEAAYDPISDNFTPDEIDASALFGMWRGQVEERGRWSEALGEPWVDISWYVTTPQIEGTFEGAPFQVARVLDEDFLTFFTIPRHAETGEDINWLRLPVADRLWRAGRADKGGFIQEATGWKPSPLEPYLHLELLVRATGRG